MTIDWGTPPGDVLRRIMAQHKMTQMVLAERMGRPVTMLSDLVTGKKQLTPQTATELERALGVSAEFWVETEARYRLRLYRERLADGE